MKVKTILVSQPEPKSESYSPFRILSKKQKIKVDFKAFIQVKGLSTENVRNQRINLQNYSAIILTSKNSVDHFFRICEKMRYKVPSELRYFCQSEGIAFYLQKYVVYRKRKIHIGKKTFLDLCEIIKIHPTETFLFPTSDELKSEVNKCLDDLKINWKRLILYKMVSSDLSDLNSILYDILVFFSPLGIKSLLKNFPDFKQNGMRIAVFGKSTIKAADDAGLKVDIFAPSEENLSMTSALEKYIKKVNKK